jgi:hypothetical protein
VKTSLFLRGNPQGSRVSVSSSHQPERELFNCLELLSCGGEEGCTVGSVCSGLWKNHALMGLNALGKWYDYKGRMVESHGFVGLACFMKIGVL